MDTENFPYTRKVAEYKGEYARGERDFIFSGEYRIHDEMRPHEMIAYNLGWAGAKRKAEWREFKQKHFSEIL